MPPVRWKLLAVTMVCLFESVYTDAQIRQDDASGDGWKPIIGTRTPNFYESFTPTSGDFYKYDVFSTPVPTITALPPTASAGPSRRPHFRGSPKPSYMPGRKIPHQKHSQPDPYFALPTHNSHGPHIPLSSVIHTRPSQIGHIKKHVTPKPYVLVTPTHKRHVKPKRIQTSTNNYRDDIFTASATSGSYSFFKQGPPSNIRTRETIDLGLPGTNHYSINQPHAHIEFTNRFALPSTSESVFQQYNNPALQAYVFGKHPQTNDISYQVQNQNDEFTRNLIPPPQVYKNKEPVNEKPQVPENVVLQAPPLFQFQSQKISEPQVQVQVTKEKFHEFHNNIPSNYHEQYINYDFSSVRKPTDAPKPVYEVTEGKVWEVPPVQPSQRPVRTRKPNTQPKRRPEVNQDIPIFLPTPYKPEAQGLEPTSPTQSEVSTIFTKLSKLQREKAATTPSPFSYNVQEVSTHYPVFGVPVFAEVHSSQEISNDITTHHEEVTTTTKEPQRIRPQRRRRPTTTRTTTTTTTESVPEVTYEVQKTQEIETPQSVETERPVRRRRPIRYRTTTTPSSSEETSNKSNRGRNRYHHRNTESFNYEPVRQRIRPKPETTTTMPENHRSAEEYYESSQMTSEAEEAASDQTEEVEDSKAEAVELELPERHYITESPKKKYETIRPFIIITTTERTPTTNLIVPENEVDVTSVADSEETTTTTPVPTTTTTTVNPHRIKGRPIKFDNSNRPRFSVKDYRQKLNQYSTSTTPEPHRSTESVRIRGSNRLRRPSSTTPANNDEESTEPARSKFVPKDPRHTGTTEDTIITDKNVKSVNTRLRPFGRYKSTTTTTTTPRISIKPNLFTRKRPPMLSLRNKIFNRYHKNNTESTEKVTTTEESEVEDTTVADTQEEEVESTTERKRKKAKPVIDETLDVDTTTVGDIGKIDPYFYSQRVSDLTSSVKNDYNTPGLFKSVSPTSRRIPNYFTIATDDPILPIEAFFPNIKDKIRDKDS